MNAEQKFNWLTTMKEHQAADRLIQGAWLRDQDAQGMFRGCFFGCAMQTDDNPLGKAAEAMGVPKLLIHLAERIFENLPEEEAVQFPVQFIEAINVDADLNNVHHTLAIERMERLIELHKDLGDKYGLLNALKLMIEYHGDPTEEKRDLAYSAANSAAYSAAWSEESANSAAYSAAYSAYSAESAESANLAESAYSAYSAESANSAANSANSANLSWSAAWKQERDVLLVVLKETK